MKTPILYTKNERGQYEEYKPKFFEDNKLYRKLANGRYEPVNMLLSQDLPEGVWVVKRQRHSKGTTSSDYMRFEYTLEKVSDLDNHVINLTTAQLGMLDKIVEDVMYKDEYHDTSIPWQTRFKKQVSEIINQLIEKS